MFSLYLGKVYSIIDVNSTLERYQGKIIGWFQGSFGKPFDLLYHRFYGSIKRSILIWIYPHHITGIPVVLDTSFNIKGEPVVETPEDAIKCFIGTGIDELYLDNLFITKKKILLDTK